MFHLGDGIGLIPLIGVKFGLIFLWLDTHRSMLIILWTFFIDHMILNQWVLLMPFFWNFMEGIILGIISI